MSHLRRVINGYGATSVPFGNRGHPLMEIHWGHRVRNPQRVETTKRKFRLVAFSSRHGNQTDTFDYTQEAMSSKSKSAKCHGEKSPERGSKVKFQARAKKSLSSEGLEPCTGLHSRRTVKATRSKNSITTSGRETSGLFTELDIAGLSKDEELGHAFDKFWKAVTNGMEKNPQVSLPRNTPIDNKMSEIQKRIKLNQAILQSANEKLKSINFKTERQNLSQWKEKMFTNFAQDDSSLFKGMKALDLEIEKLRQRKSDKNVFLKSSPGIANFHKTMESTLNMLDKIQNTNEFQDYDKSFHTIKKEFDLDYIKAPDLIAVSDEE